MVKVSDLLGKPLISLADAKSVGYLSNLWFDDKLLRVKTAEITNDYDEYPERTYAPFRFMRCDGDAAVIKSLSCVTEKKAASSPVPCPINRECFNQNGNSLGKVRDVVLEGNAVAQIFCEKATFTPKELLTLGNNLCIFNDTGAPIKLPKPRTPRPRVPKPVPQHAEIPVSIYSPVQTPPTPQNVTVTRTPGDPIKDYSFLMGKPVHTPVLCGGKILIPAGTVVSEKIIELARKENKLVQLALRAY